MSGIGKGIVVASLGSLLIESGLKVLIKKLDPYLNVDAGTMNPYEHGETFVTTDGLEADLDLGHYERFTGMRTTKNNIVTSGKIYSNVIQKERKGEYLGKTVQLIPHVSNEIIKFIKTGSEDYDIIICEVGGNVGDIEAMMYLEAIRQLVNEYGRKNVLNVHLTYVPFLKVSEEFKTKPAQESIKKLLQVGITADIVVARFEDDITTPDFAQKIAHFGNLKEKYVILAPNVDNIYKIPYIYAEQGLQKKVLKLLRIKDKELNIKRWQKIKETLDNLSGSIVVNIIVKYVYKDAYISLIEALKHAAYNLNKNLSLNWIDARNSTEKELLDKLKTIKGGILVPGGFGEAGVENKIKAIQYARENDIPFLGICYGMQLMAIEFARNVLNIKNATTAEIDPTDKATHIVHIIDPKQTSLGGTMRLGNYTGEIKKGSLAEKIYGDTSFTERHRHRYEINTQFRKDFEKKGLIFSGTSEKETYMEIAEIPKLTFFYAVQFHPEFNSSIFVPNPSILAFMKAASKKT